MVSTLILAALATAPVQKEPPVKVFLLVGQSNMVGHGFIAADPKRNGGKGSLEFMAREPSSDPKFKDLLDKDGKWRVRDDVWIHYFDRKGQLTVGYGAGEDCIGPELGFGNVVGDAIKEPVLLVKLAWGGKSLYADFRPPSSGGKLGPYYTEVIKGTVDAIAKIGTNFPQFKGRAVEIAGFGWHQGWNDRINADAVAEYEQNMANFIKDVRKDLNVPKLPFVIAETGMGGFDEVEVRALALMNAQAAVAKRPEFKNTVAFVGTRAFWRDAEASPSDQVYHWNNSGETYYLIGDAMGHAMNDLLKQSKR